MLVDRFLRLCIEDGPGRAHPRAILAITFTRTAAAELVERLAVVLRAAAGLSPLPEPYEPLFREHLPERAIKGK